MAGTPARWQRAGGRSPLPCSPAANSGQIEATGSSSRAGLVDQLQGEEGDERLADRVEVDQGIGPPRAPLASVQPPTRSTTSTPSTNTQTPAPTSPRSAKLRANSSSTAAKQWSQTPEIGTSTDALCPSGLSGASVGSGWRPETVRPALPASGASAPGPLGPPRRLPAGEGANSPGRARRGPGPSRCRRPGAASRRRSPTAVRGTLRLRPRSWRHPDDPATPRCRR